MQGLVNNLLDQNLGCFRTAAAARGAATGGAAGFATGLETGLEGVGAVLAAGFTAGLTDGLAGALVADFTATGVADFTCGLAAGFAAVGSPRTRPTAGFAAGLVREELTATRAGLARGARWDEGLGGLTPTPRFRFDALTWASDRDHATNVCETTPSDMRPATL